MMGLILKNAVGSGIELITIECLLQRVGTPWLLGQYPEKLCYRALVPN